MCAIIDSGHVFLFLQQIEYFLKLKIPFQSCYPSQSYSEEISVCIVYVNYIRIYLLEV